MKIVIELDEMLAMKVRNQAKILSMVRAKYPDTVLSPADKVLLLVHDKLKDVAKRKEK